MSPVNHHPDAAHRTRAQQQKHVDDLFGAGKICLGEWRRAIDELSSDAWEAKGKKPSTIKQKAETT